MLPLSFYFQLFSYKSDLNISISSTTKKKTSQFYKTCTDVPRYIGRLMFQFKLYRNKKLHKEFKEI